MYCEYTNNTYTTTRVSTDHNSHTFCYFVFVFWKRYLFRFVVCGVGWSLFSLLHPSLLAVFRGASVFNQDVSKWNTGAVTIMNMGKCTLSLSLSLSLATPSAVVYFEYTTTRVRVSSNLTSHTFCSFCFCIFKCTLCCWLCGGLFILFFVAPSLAVFQDAPVFNQDVSEWKTGAVTEMWGSKCTLSLSVATPSVVMFFNTLNCTTTRVPSDSHTFCYFLFLWFDLFCGLWWVGLSFSLIPSLLQCLMVQRSSIRTCPNGLRARWKLCLKVSVLSLPLCRHAFRCCVRVHVFWMYTYDKTRVLYRITCTILTCFVILFLCVWKRYVSFLLFVVGWSFFSLLNPLLQCLSSQLRSILTCPNGIRARWQICNNVSALFLSLCILNIRQLEFHRITILTRFCYFNFCVFETVPFLLLVVGWSFLSFVAPSSCSVWLRTCVQFGLVQMEYGRGDNYERQ